MKGSTVGDLISILEKYDKNIILYIQDPNVNESRWYSAGSMDTKPSVANKFGQVVMFLSGPVMT